MMLITGHPRSGTKYMSWFLSVHGLNMPHEGNTAMNCSIYEQNLDGVVSYEHIKDHDKYDVIIHQVREPLKTISSSLTNQYETWLNICSIIKNSPYGWEDLRNKYFASRESSWMWSWLSLNEYIEKYAEWRFKIEELEDNYKELCNRLGIKPLDVFPPIPTNHNTRKHKTFTWSDLMSIDSDLTERIKLKAKEYGYN
jgi:hypothetical protein